jgi:circadian clock protein KaiC
MEVMTPHTTTNGAVLARGETVYVPKIATGIHGFEIISEGGIPQGRTTLVAGTSGSGKTVFGVEFLWQGVTQFHEPGVFVTFEETPEDIGKNFCSMGLDLCQLEKEGKIAFVDASPSLESNTEVGSFDFGALIARVIYAIEKVNAKRVTIDSISALFPQFSDPGVVRRELFRLAAQLKAQGVTTVVTAERLHEYGEIARFGVEEFVSDNVIILRNILDDEKRRRTCEILKYRGSMHQKGEYPFTVTTNGIKILPLSGMSLTQKSSLTRISSGSAELDTMCGGGFFRDSIILVSGPTGTGKTLIVSTFVNAACEAGEKALLFAFEESAEQLIRNGTSWGIDLRKWVDTGLLKIVCRYPEAMGPEDHLLSIKKDIEEFGPQRIAVDSLSAMERVVTEKSFREFVISITSYIKSKEMAGVFTNTSETLMGGDSITETHISTLTDSIIILRYVEMMGAMCRAITAIKMRGSAHDKDIHEYVITNDGMQIRKPFSNVEGILTGQPRSVVQGERETLKELL